LINDELEFDLMLRKPKKRTEALINTKFYLKSYLLAGIYAASSGYDYYVNLIILLG
jgi:hypothetical protein